MGWDIVVAVFRVCRGCSGREAVQVVLSRCFAGVSGGVGKNSFVVSEGPHSRTAGPGGLGRTVQGLYICPMGAVYPPRSGTVAL